MGPANQTTSTSLTDPAEQQPPPGWKSHVPRTPDQSAREWRESPESAVAMKSNGDVISFYHEYHHNARIELNCFQTSLTQSGQELAKFQVHTDLGSCTLSLPGMRQIASMSVFSVGDGIDRWCIISRPP